MEQTTLHCWQRLHIRVVCGERLTAEEQTLYQAGLHELEKSESIGAATVARISEMRQQVRKLDAEHTALAAERQRLEDEIRRLEAAQDERTRQQLSQEE